MTIGEELKIKLFRVKNLQEDIHEFETWLYQQDDLAEKMNEDFYLDLFAFNYHQADVLDHFIKMLDNCFSKSEFLCWQIKENLKRLITDQHAVEPILYKFRMLSYKYDFLKELGYYEYDFEEIENLLEREKLIKEVATLAAQLLVSIEAEERIIKDFDITCFPYFKDK